MMFNIPEYLTEDQLAYNCIQKILENISKDFDLEDLRVIPPGEPIAGPKSNIVSLTPTYILDTKFCQFRSKARSQFDVYINHILVEAYTDMTMIGKSVEYRSTVLGLICSDLYAQDLETCIANWAKSINNVEQNDRSDEHGSYASR